MPGAQMDLGALTGPIEVGIGIAVSYLGFNRFRYRDRVRKCAQELAVELAKPTDVLKASLEDGKITTDERGLLTLFWFTEDGTFRRALSNEKNHIKNGNMFWNSLCFWLLQIFIDWKIDRKSTQFLLMALCGSELLLSWLLLLGATKIPFLTTHAFGNLYFCVVTGTYLIPAISFALSEWMMLLISKSADSWRQSMMVQSERAASSATLSPNNSGLKAP